MSLILPSELWNLVLDYKYQLELTPLKEIIHLRIPYISRYEMTFIYVRYEPLAPLLHDSKGRKIREPYPELISFNKYTLHFDLIGPPAVEEYMIEDIKDEINKYKNKCKCVGEIFTLVIKRRRLSSNHLLFCNCLNASYNCGYFNIKDYGCDHIKNLYIIFFKQYLNSI